MTETTTALAVRESAAVAIPDKIQYAKALADSGLLPQAYRKQPANILYAVEYGEMLGLPAMAAITGIHVIDGRPAISAGLISALVRRAGHRLRVTGDEHQAQAFLTRADDPGFTYKATWTIDRAKQAGLLGKTNWSRYPAAMLKARVVSEVARDACQEVLLGMQYTPDELGIDDDGGEVVHDGYDTRPDGSVDTSRMPEEEKDRAGLMTREQRLEHERLRRMNEPDPGTVDKRGTADPDDPWAEPAQGITEPQSRKLHAVLGEIGKKAGAALSREQRLTICSTITGRDLESSADLLKDETVRLIDTLEQISLDDVMEMLATQPPAGGETDGASDG